MNKEKASAKVKKLMAIAMDERGNANEAERALMQAETMMRKYGLEQADIAEDIAPSFEWGNVEVGYNQTTDQNWIVQKTPTWYQWIAVGIANYTDTIARNSWSRDKYGAGIKFYGEEQDLPVAEWLLLYLQKQVDTQVERQTDLDRSGKTDFRKGMASRLLTRLNTLRKERNQAFAEAPSNKGTGTALVLVNTKLAERDKKFGQANYGKSNATTRSHEAVARGRHAADNVAINRAIAGTSSAKRIAA